MLKKNRLSEFDLLIVGAGPVGCVIAERAATEMGWSSVIIDKRDHIAGNCFDVNHSSGVRVHRYGPHYFRTNQIELLNYLSNFTDWIPGYYFVKTFFRGELFPFPINLLTLRQFFGMPDLTVESAKLLLESKRQKIEQPKNSEEFVLSRVGKELYEAFYLGYTLKQWDRHPRELDPSVCGRIPIRFSEDSRYVDHLYQVMPAHGFTELFSKMIHHEKIKVLLKTEYSEAKKELFPKLATVYCGPIDEYFEKKLGDLPWRSLEFEFKALQKQFAQSCVQINYPNDFNYTRTTEIKHVTQQVHPDTVLCYEYPRAMGDPYYPIPAVKNTQLYKEYELLAARETLLKKVYFSGRLAQYRYLNMDEAIESALRTFNQMKTDLFKLNSAA